MSIAFSFEGILSTGLYFAFITVAHDETGNEEEKITSKVNS